MSFEPQQPPPRPTLEDLLRFKRAERPPPEFWAEFDRGLRQKQLAALMKRPQGWARVRPVVISGLRWAVPATAAAAVALVILQLPRGVTSKPEAGGAVAVAEPAHVAEQPVLLAVVQVEGMAPEVQFENATQTETSVMVEQDESMPVAEAVRPQVALPEVVEHTLPWSAASLAYGDLPDYSASTFTSVSLPARETRRSNSSWTSRFSEMVRELTDEQSEVRVMQLASLEFSGANEYATATVPIGANQTVASNGRSGRTLSQREFRDLDSRFGVKGTSVSIKF